MGDGTVGPLSTDEVLPAGPVRVRPAVSPITPRRVTLSRRLGRSPVGLIGAVLVALVLMIAALAPFLAPSDPDEQALDHRELPPAWLEGGSPDHLLGTDQLGRDVLSRLIYGSRVSVVVGVSAVSLAGVVGVLVGLAAGLASRWIDTILMRVADAFLAIPYLILVLAVIGVLGPGPVTLVVVLGVLNWMEYARVVRGEVLVLREREFVEAARAVGATGARIAARHIFPNLLASVIVLATLNVATTIIAESALSFLGVGIQPPTVTWGGMLAAGRDYVATAWWLAAFPGMAIAATVLGILFLGDWLRSVLDPRLR